MPQDFPSPLPTDVTPEMASPEANRAAMAAALRRQQMPGGNSPDLLFAMGENPLAAPYGHAALQARHQQAQLAQEAAHMQSEAETRRQQQAIEAARAASMEQHQRTMEGIARLQLAQGRFAQGPYGVLNTRTGQLDPYSKEGAGAGLKPKDVQAQFDAFQKELSSSGRGNLNAERQKRLDAAERLEALIGKPGQIQNLTPQQVREASTALANLISQGAVSEHQIEELTPETSAGKWAALKQKVLNEPQGADAQAFLSNMLETAGRETAVTRKQMRETMLGYIPRRWGLRKMDQQTFDAMLQQHGLNPEEFDEAGRLKQQQAAGGLTPEQQKRLSELRAKRDAGALK